MNKPLQKYSRTLTLVFPTAIACISTLISHIPIIPRNPTPIFRIPTLIPHIPTMISCIPTLIPCIPIIHYIPHIPTSIPHISTLIPCIPTLILCIPIIPLIPFPNFPSRLLQILVKSTIRPMLYPSPPIR